jgi:hypothetical protein
MPLPVFAIYIEPAEQVQREQVHALILENANDWWHGMEDLWLVVGARASYWRDLLGAIFPTTTSGRILVLKLDTAPNEGRWAYRATFGESGQQWIEEKL